MANDPFSEMSGLTKVHIGIVIAAAAIMVFGIIFQAREIGSAGLAILLGAALTEALDDPETDEPLAFALRLIIGAAVGIIFGLIIYSARGVWN